MSVKVCFETRGRTWNLEADFFLFFCILTTFAPRNVLKFPVLSLWPPWNILWFFLTDK